MPSRMWLEAQADERQRGLLPRGSSRTRPGSPTNWNARSGWLRRLEPERRHDAQTEPREQRVDRKARPIRGDRILEFHVEERGSTRQRGVRRAAGRRNARSACSKLSNDRSDGSEIRVAVTSAGAERRAPPRTPASPAPARVGRRLRASAATRPTSSIGLSSTPGCAGKLKSRMDTSGTRRSTAAAALRA